MATLEWCRPMETQSLLFVTNIFEWIRIHGGEPEKGKKDFEPQVDESNPEFEPTNSLPGTFERHAVYVDRVERGFPIWHSRDRKSLEESPLAGTDLHKYWLRASSLERCEIRRLSRNESDFESDDM